jgi:hypothetical protein
MFDHLAYLRDAHARGVLVPFVGAGLGTASANLPSWPALLSDGIDYAKEILGVASVDTALREIKFHESEGRFVEAFSELARLLNVDIETQTSLEWESFIAEKFADPVVTNPDLLDALSYISPSRVVTTNYDQLLERWQIGDGRTLTWQDASGIRDAFRLGSGVIHLHGVWNRPSSIVLSQDSYASVVADEPARQVARVIFHGSVLLFIGTSLDGTHDPHLSELLSEFEALADHRSGERAPHVMLVRGAVTGSMRARLNRQGIVAVSYGGAFKELPEFLRSIPGRGMSRIDVGEVSGLLRTIGSSSTLDDALRGIARWVERVVFSGRQIRISYSEKSQVPDGWELRRRAVIPATTTGNPHNYPLSMSGWSLVEGRPIEWPRNAERSVDVNWLRRCNKYEFLNEIISNPKLNDIPELRRYVDIIKIRDSWLAGSLTLGDFFQDWASDQLSLPYRQFVTIPVPWIESASTRGVPKEYGVFNIDSLDSNPLLNYRTDAQLRLASEAAVLAYAIHELTD